MLSKLKIMSLLSLPFLAFAACREKKDSSKVNAVKQEASTKPGIVFLLGGQSNMEGYAQVSKEVVGELSSVNNVFVYCAHHSAFDSQSIQWSAGKKPTWKNLQPCGGFPATMGPEVSFGLLASKAFPDKNVYLIKYAKGSTSVFCNWQPPSRTEAYKKYQGDAICKDPEHSNQDPSYLRFEKTVADGIAEIPAAVKWSWGGMLWVQGEQDASGGKHPFFAETYQENLGHLVQTIRAKLQFPQLTFVAAKIKAGAMTSASGQGPSPLKLVRDSIHNIAVKDGSFKTFETWDLPSTEGDCWHFTTESVLTIGARFAQALGFGKDAGRFPPPKTATCTQMFTGPAP